MNKNQSGFSSVVIALIVIILALVAGTFVYATNKSNQNKPSDDHYDDQHNSDYVTMLTGTLNKILPDCSQGQYLDENGNAQTLEATICDAGSFIQVDSVQIQYASGYTTPEDAFSVDISNLKLGDKVQTHYLRTAENEGTLDCEGCYIVREMDNPQE